MVRPLAASHDSAVAAPAQAERPSFADDGAMLVTPHEVPVLPKAQLLFNFWESRRDHGGIVIGRDMPSSGVAPILRDLAVFEPVDNGADVRIRLAGPGLLKRFDRLVQGCLLSEVYGPEHFLLVRATVLGVAHSGEPRVHAVMMRTRRGDLHRFEVAHVPCFAPDGTTPWDLAGYFFFS